MTLRKRFGTGRLALLVGLGLLGCLAFADVSSAAVPPSGNNCVLSDGKINGRGSTFQKTLVNDLAGTYRDDFCGAVGAESTEKGAASNTMVAYDYPAAENNNGTGSGAGLKAMNCRTDAFAGTDVPYTKLQLEEENGAPGAGKELGGGACTLAFTPPFEPNTPASWPDKEAGKEDQTAKVMSFPIGGSSVALPVHLTAAECGGTSPAPLEFTPKEVYRIFGGEASEWDEAELVATNPSLKNCAKKITRVVRLDNSGTTNEIKLYLQKVQPSRAGAACSFKGETWQEMNAAPNTNWPTEGTCTTLVRGEKNGGPSLIKKVVETAGGVGYADLADAVNEEAKANGLILPSVENATGTSFQPPNVEKGANCDYKLLELPGTTANEAVGLNTEESWANNNPGGNKGDATDKGEKYPICGLTWDMVYTGLDNGAVPNAISRLSADQRRTEYSFFTFVLSSAAQQTFSSINYAELPTSWVGTLREGFQKNY